MERNTLQRQDTTDRGKTIAIIAYLTFIGLIIAFVMNNEKKEQFASFHIKQSLGLALTGFSLSFIMVIPILGWVVGFLGFFLLLFLWVVGIINVVNGKEKPVPILGEKFKEWFKNI